VSDRGFERTDHVSEAGFLARGSDLGELFRNAGRGLFSLIGTLDAVRPAVRREIELSAENADGLLHAFLDELVYLSGTHREIYAEFEIRLGGDRRLFAVAVGERMDRARHVLENEVKAVTWQDFGIRRTREGFEARVVVDI
jgi:SHS2 domain-containing protein